MAKFNQTRSNITQNISGHAAYRMDDKSKLITQVLTSFFNEAKYYGDNSAELEETLKRVLASDPQFVANLAVYARREFHMRSVAHVLTAYLAHEPQGKPFVRRTVKGVALRGDDLTEIMAFYLNTFGKPIPNSLRKGINDVLVGLDEYTLAKYKGTGKGVKMRDLLCLCRPAPKNEAQSAMWKRCLEGKLAVPLTWETELSAHGNNTETWEKLIDSGKVGYMALLRNLRNILQARPANIEKVYATLADPEMVRKSKQLPFRFLSAYKAVSGIADSRVFDVLEAAAEASSTNLPTLPGTTVIAVDTSGSMSSCLSAHSDVRCVEVGVLLGLLANRMCETSIFYTFSSELIKHPVSRQTDPLYAAMHMVYASGGTYMELPFEQMSKDNVQADRIIVISDNECNSSWSTPVQELADKCRQEMNRDFWVHAVDLEGYGTQQFAGAKTNLIAGWSEKLLDFIQIAEQGEDSLLQAVQTYTWQ